MTITEGNQLASPASQPLSATDREKAVKQREENQKKFVYATKEVSPTTPKGEANLPTFDSTKELPPTVLQTPKWQFNFKTSFIGLEAVKPLLTTQKAGQMELNAVTFMPPNLTRLRPDKFSDEFFVERRLNGFNPGQLKRVEQQPWQYVSQFNFSDVKVDPNGILPKIISARFCLHDQQLSPHSIEYILHGETQTQTQRPGDLEWEWAKKLYRCTEFLSHEIRSHLGGTHLNMEQYAMAYYRNVSNNPIVDLLEPHLEGLLPINKQGLVQLVGVESNDGLAPALTSLNLQDTNRILLEEVTRLTYRNWSPRQQTLPDYVANNHFDRAAIAMWGIITEYVKRFFDRNQAGIQQYWSEIAAMSKDLSANSILKPEFGTLDIKTLADLRELCVYVIYISTFQHSWVNNKQYEDGGDIEYTTLGLWQKNGQNEGQIAQMNARQLTTLWNLTSVRYNPIMDVGSNYPANELKEALWKHRDQIEPGIPVESILMSISI
jgi:hypothetical protein